MGYILYINGYKTKGQKNPVKVISECFGKLWGYQEDNDGIMQSMQYALTINDFKEDVEETAQFYDYPLYEVMHNIMWGSPYCIYGEYDLTIEQLKQFTEYYIKDVKAVWGDVDPNYYHEKLDKVLAVSDAVTLEFI